MPLQNRVTPFGDIVSSPARGMFTGNRGILHDPETRTLTTRRWTSQAWLICALDYRGARRTVMGQRSWTELFFLDEATALAAGHRPCFLCRRAAALAFQASFPASLGRAMSRAGEIDRVLHAERLDGHSKRLHSPRAPTASLPDGAMVLQSGAPHLILGGRAYPWSHSGYGAPTSPQGGVTVLTPPSTLAALEAGYRAQVHPSIEG
jgi:hypothetical protein